VWLPLKSETQNPMMSGSAGTSCKDFGAYFSLMPAGPGKLGGHAAKFT